MIIPYSKNRLEEVNAKIEKLKAELSLLHEERSKLIEDIQKACSHPAEYQEQILINDDRDALEAKIYHLKCLACGKILEKYSIVNGNKVQYKENKNWWKDWP